MGPDEAALRRPHNSALYVVTEIRASLLSLAEIIAPFDQGIAKHLSNLSHSNPQAIADDLSIWGGAGSLMDEFLAGERNELRRMFEAKAVILGNLLLTQGARNKRMENWIAAFQTWNRHDV